MIPARFTFKQNTRSRSSRIKTHTFSLGVTNYPSISRTHTHTTALWKNEWGWIWCNAVTYNCLDQRERQIRQSILQLTLARYHTGLLLLSWLSWPPALPSTAAKVYSRATHTPRGTMVAVVFTLCTTTLICLTFAYSSPSPPPASLIAYSRHASRSRWWKWCVLKRFALPLSHTLVSKVTEMIGGVVKSVSCVHDVDIMLICS